MAVQIQYRAASTSDSERIKSLLTKNQLPEIGVDNWLENFVLAEEQNGSLVGVAGLELYARSGLLRSVAVDEKYRRQGHGRMLVELIVSNAKARGVKAIFLLTEDAVPYFERLGFRPLSRQYVPEEVKASVEFTEMCETATVMRREFT